MPSDVYSQDLLDAVEVVLHFAVNVPGGCSYWIDEESNSHTADMGYVCEFLDDLKEHLEKKLYADKFIRNEVLSPNEVRAIVGYKPVDPKEKGDCDAAED